MSCNGSNEFFIIYTSVSVLVGIVDHLVNLLGSESLAHHVTHSLEVLRPEAVGSIGIEGFVELLEGGLGGVFGLPKYLYECFEIELFGGGACLHDIHDVLGLTL